MPIPLGTRCRFHRCFAGKTARPHQVTSRYGPHRREQELTHPRMVERLRRLNVVVLKALRLGIGIGIENWFINWSTTRPETATTHFVRIGFNHYKSGAVWYAKVRRGRTTGKAGDGQIKGSPEKLYWARFAYESRTKLRKHSTDLHQNAPKPSARIRDHRLRVSDRSQMGFDLALRPAWSRWLQASQAISKAAIVS